MTQPDTAIYHGPVMARFLQQGRFDSLDGIAGVGQRYFHYNSELIHALAAMPFGRDVASPLINLGWAALPLLAAWCIGKVGGVQYLSLLGAAALLSLPALAANQPGQASNDIVCAALFLAPVALLLQQVTCTNRPTAVAGIAAGLALSTKLVVFVPLVVLSVGIMVIAFADAAHRGRGMVRGACALRHLLARAQLGPGGQPAPVHRDPPRADLLAAGRPD